MVPNNRAARLFNFSNWPLLIKLTCFQQSDVKINFQTRSGLLNHCVRSVQTRMTVFRYFLIYNLALTTCNGLLYGNVVEVFCQAEGLMAHLFDKSSILGRNSNQEEESGYSEWKRGTKGNYLSLIKYFK